MSAKSRETVEEKEKTYFNSVEEDSDMQELNQAVYIDAIDYNEDSVGNMRPMCLLRPIESTPTEDGRLLAANA